MITKNVDGTEVKFLLYQYCSARVDDINEHVEIFPNEEYWETKTSIQEVQLLDETSDNPECKAFNDRNTKYWVPRDLLDRAVKLGGSYGIERPHVDNLLMIIHSFHLYAMNMEGKDILEYADDFKTMEKLDYKLNHFVTNFLKVEVTVGRVKHLLPREHIQIEKFKFESERFLDPLHQHFMDWMKSDSFKKSISYWYSWASNAMGYHQKIKLTKDRLYLMVYEYIMNHDLAKSTFDACKKAGLFFALDPDIFKSRQEWEDGTSAGGSHADYESYIGNRMRMRLTRARKNVFEQKK